MRIISKYRDYYDGASAHGQDTTDRFLRMEAPLGGPVATKLAKPLGSVFQVIQRRGEKYSATAEPFLIYFCGKMYPAIRAHFYGLDDPYPSVEKFYYTWATAHAGFVRAGLQLEGVTHRWFRRSIAVRWEEFMQRRRADVPLLREEKLAVVSVFREEGQYVVTSNPRLGQYDFVTVFPPYQAYQELQMWVTGVLPAPNAPMLVVSERDRVMQHGFDKWSFRKKGPNSK
jgi:hypothetical protein